MVSGRNGLTGAHALNNASTHTVVVVLVLVLGLDPEPAQIPRLRSEASLAADILRRTSIAQTTVLVIF